MVCAVAAVDPGDREHVRAVARRDVELLLVDATRRPTVSMTSTISPGAVADPRPACIADLRARLLETDVDRSRRRSASEPLERARAAGSRSRRSRPRRSSSAAKA